MASRCLSSRFYWPSLLTGIALIFCFKAAAVTLESVYSFQKPPWHPIGALVQTPEGHLYGVSHDGGATEQGCVFKLSTNSSLTIITSFNGTNGTYPTSLIEGNDGFLYGTTSGGGEYNAGTIFKITGTGELSTLFAFNITNGAVPMAPLLPGPDKRFYGTTPYGGSSGLGTVFRISTSGEFTSLLSFNGTNGSVPYFGLVCGPDEKLYGLTSGSIVNTRNFFSITTNGNFAVVADFTNIQKPSPDALILGTNGYFYGWTPDAIFKLSSTGILTPIATNCPGVTGMVQASDGSIYVSTGGGGDLELGTISRLEFNGDLTMIFSFDGTNGSGPSIPIVGRDGALYGTTRYGGTLSYGTAYRVTTNGEVELAVQFASHGGQQPSGGLIFGKDGSLYGATDRGGEMDLGTVFKLTRQGKLVTLTSFCQTNGAHPQSPLLLARNGFFYGTTQTGGESDMGTLFQLASNGTFFSSISFVQTNEAFPNPGLAQSTNGDIYGTTAGEPGDLQGTVFKLSENGQLSTPVSFMYPTNSGNPTSGLLIGADGNLYGTTTFGGTNRYQLPNGNEVQTSRMFKLSLTDDLSTFASFTLNGIAPKLTQASDGNFYGVRWSYDNSWQLIGTILRISTNGVVSSFVSFSEADGDIVASALVQGRDGYLYGYTPRGGTNRLGGIFRVGLDGTFTRLCTLDARTGTYPIGQLVEADDGTFYGATTSDGENGGGGIFRLILHQITSISYSAGHPLLTISGVPGESYTIQTATNLISPVWQNLGSTSAPPSGEFQFHDTTSSSAGARFYRTATP